MSNNAFFAKIDQIRRAIPEVIRRLPGIAKVEGLNFIHDNFEKQGFEIKTGIYNRWQNRQKIQAYKKSARKFKKSSALALTKAGKLRAKNTPILIGEVRGGKLRRSWDRDTSTSETSVSFGSSLPYAGVHNDGLRAGRPPGFTMPERKMIGESEALNQRIEAKLDRLVEGVFK